MIDLIKLPSNIESETDVPELLRELEMHRVKPSDQIPPPEIALKMLNEDKPDEYGVLGTLGNFSVITGKAKSRKTFYITILISALLTDKPIFRTFTGCLPPSQCKVLYFDTEQGKWHVQQVAKRICNLTGNPDPENLLVYGLRSEPTKKRLQFIETKIYNTENVGFVIIDGIRDLTFDINDATAAAEIAGNLLKWTEQRNIHLLTVLHQNKGDSNARGHLGTELVNKAETILSVEKIKDKGFDISVVTPQQCRNREPDPFAFAIDNGLPYKTILPQSEKKKRFEITDITDEKIKELIEKAFLLNDNLPMTDGSLKMQIKIASKGFFIEKDQLNDNEVSNIKIIGGAKNIIFQDKPRAPFQFRK